jgi:hypothetical protein
MNVIQPFDLQDGSPGYYRGKPGIPDVILQASRRSERRTGESREFFRVTGKYVHNPLSWHRIIRIDGRLYMIAQPTVVSGGGYPDATFVETELHPADIIRVDGVDHCVVSWPLHDPVLEPLPFYHDLVSFGDRGQPAEGRVIMVAPGERGATAVIEEEGTATPFVRLVGAITVVACDVMRISFASRHLQPPDA